MADPVDICRLLVVGNDPVNAIITGRAYRADAVPSQATRPLVQLTLVADEPDYDCDGSLDDTFCTIKLDAVVDSGPAGSASLVALVDALRVIVGYHVSDIGDEPSGPTDSQGRTAFVRSLTVQFTY